MATAKNYGLGMVKVISGSINFTGDSIKCALVASTYTPNQDTHEFWDEVEPDEVSGTNYDAGGVALTGKSISTYNTTTNTVAWLADSPSWTSLGESGTPVEARYAVFYKWTGTASTSPLLSYIDFGTTQSAEGDNVSVIIPASGISQWTVL